jgi:VWFA-related protein
MILVRAAAAILLLFMPLTAATRILVTVVERRTARIVEDLKAADFVAKDSGQPRTVEAAEFGRDPVDVLLLLDASMMGQAVQQAAADLIQQLEGKEQMALIAFHSAADQIQDFTSSKEALLRALSRLKYGNEPRVLDALYAAADGGFENAIYRKAILLLTTGFEGSSRLRESEVIKLAQRSGVSIYPVYMTDIERGMFEKVARGTAGVPVRMKDLEKAQIPPAKQVMNLVRSRYILTLSGNLRLSDRFELNVSRPGKYFVSVLPLE